MIEKMFFEYGKKIDIDGKSRFFIDNVNKVYFVKEGFIDIFLIETDNDEISGSREHFLRIEKNNLFSGVISENQEFKYFLSAISGTVIYEIDIERLCDINSVENKTELCEKIDEYIKKCISKYISNKNSLKTQELDYGKHFIEQDLILNSKEKIKWVLTDENNLGKLKNNFDLDVIYKDVTASIEKDVNISIYSTDEILKINFKDLFIKFNKKICNIHKEKISKNLELEKYLLKEKIKKEDDIKRNSIRLLSSILTEEKLVLESESSNHIEYAMQILGKYMKLNIIIPSEDMKTGDDFGDILRSSDLNYRKVILKDDWYKKDNGPLIAYIKDTSEAVALIPNKPGKYKIYKKDNLPTDLIEENAIDLSPFAFVVYKPFPKRKLNIKDILKYSMDSSWLSDKITLLLTGVLVGLAGLIIPMATGVIIDSVIPQADISGLVSIALVLFTTAMSILVFNISKAIATIRIEGKTDSAVQAAIWDRLLSLPASFFKDYTAGDLASRAMGINSIRVILSGTTLRTLFSGVFSIFYVILLFYYSTKLAFIAVLLSLIGIVFSSVCSYMQVSLNKKLVHIEGKISGLVFQILSGIAKFRVAGAENRAFYLWAKEFSEKKEISYKNGKIQNYIEIFNSAFPVICSMVIFGFLVLKGERNDTTGLLTLSTGHFLAFNAAFTTYLTSIINVTESMTSILEVIPVYNRAKPIIETDPEINEAKASPGKLTGKIDVSHISFKYDKEGPLILDDVSLEVKPGEFVAIIGPSGSGKSTLFRLLLGFEFPQNGAVYYDGQDLSSLDIRALRRQIGVVLQNGKLMSGDIFTNIIGSRNLKLEDAWEAARASGLEEDIQNMPMGMHTMLSEGAGTISGGQKQRMLIAKAIVHKPEILYFDEATSALDNRTQAIVSKSVEKLRSTRIVIAHRLSTIMNADKIVVLEKGKIVQQGRYQDLLKEPGTFAELAKRQLT